MSGASPIDASLIRARIPTAIRVAGVTFAPGYPRNLVDLQRRFLVEDEVVLDLVRDYDNGHDLNAISVQLEGRHLGHLPAPIAALIAPELDHSGTSWRARAVYVAVDPDHKNRPGLEIELFPSED